LPDLTRFEHTASEDDVQRHEIVHLGTTKLKQRLFSGKQIPLCVEHFEIADDAFTVPRLRELGNLTSVAPPSSTTPSAMSSTPYAASGGRPSQR
jgi:hypothetical protein